jgi:hypothetical protein
VQAPLAPGHLCLLYLIYHQDLTMCTDTTLEGTLDSMDLVVAEVGRMATRECQLEETITRTLVAGVRKGPTMVIGHLIHILETAALAAAVRQAVDIIVIET